MGEKHDADNEDGPSLEMPSLSLRRHKKGMESKPEPADVPLNVDSAGSSVKDESVLEDNPAIGDEPAQVDVPEPSVAPAPSRSPKATKPPKPPKQPKVPKPPKALKPPKPKRELPLVPGQVAAIITGAVIGLLGVGLTYVGLQGCEAIKGTTSCGGPGLFLLIAILAALVVIGGGMLKAFRVSDPSSTSFLAVGLLVVVVLLFLVEVIFEWWMIIVIPLISIGMFWISHFVTARFIEPAEQ